MNQLHYQQFTPEDAFIVRSNLASKYDAIGTLVKYFAIITAVGFALLLIRVNTVPPVYFFSAMTLAFVGFLLYFWFHTITSLRKDLRQGQKAAFTAKVMNKKSSSELGITSHYLLVEDNVFGITRVDVTPEIFDQIETFCVLKLTVSRHSGTFLECEIKEE